MAFGDDKHTWIKLSAYSSGHVKWVRMIDKLRVLGDDLRGLGLHHNRSSEYAGRKLWNVLFVSSMVSQEQCYGSRGLIASR